MEGVSTAASTWLDGIRRHLDDLRNDRYEGTAGGARQQQYVNAFDLLTPVAVEVLRQISEGLLRGKGTVAVRTPEADGGGGSIGSWTLTWPELVAARSRMTGKALAPVTISAIFPAGFTHPHLVAGGPVDPRAESISAWPMQVTTGEDAERQRATLWAIAIAEV
ncbi:MAG TPA: hypothetical protein VM674_09310, partial [Candidatus Acidoferrum sp.]|nr:hypothetical protein [Candidatus Acidoferrum sp.]